MAPFWHRWSYFSILNLSVFHLADKFTNNSFLRVQKNPGNLAVPGYLTFGHNEKSRFSHTNHMKNRHLHTAIHWSDIARVDVL